MTEIIKVVPNLIWMLFLRRSDQDTGIKVRPWRTQGKNGHPQAKERGPQEKPIALIT